MTGELGRSGVNTKKKGAELTMAAGGSRDELSTMWKEFPDHQAGRREGNECLI